MTALSRFESDILFWIQNNLRGPFDGIALFITSLADYGWFWIALTALLLFIRKTRSRALGPAFSLVFEILTCNLGLKLLIARPRPFLSFDFLIPLGRIDYDTSFPSGHTCASFAAATAIACMYGKKAGIPALVLASLIALSRMYVGVHYPSDVIAGTILGISCGLAGSAINNAIIKRMTRNNTAPND